MQGAQRNKLDVSVAGIQFFEVDKNTALSVLTNKITTTKEIDEKNMTSSEPKNFVLMVKEMTNKNVTTMIIMGVFSKNK